MSAFVCSDHHYQRVADSLRYILDYQEEHRHPVEIFLEAVGGKTPAQAMADVRLMNRAAVFQRYEDKDMLPEDSAPLLERPGVPLQPKQLYGALSCIRYQCSEGSVPDSPLYKALDKLVDSLGASFFQATYDGEHHWSLT